MAMSSSSNQSKYRVRSSVNQKLPMSLRIASAIREKCCPICLRHIDDRKAAVLTTCMHAYCIDCIRQWSKVKRNCPLCNAEFCSWFFKIRVSTGTFEQQRLPDVRERKTIDINDYRSERFLLLNEQKRLRQFPWRRSFGRSRFLPYNQRQRHEVEVVAERVLRWRSSIYNRRLQAVPLPSRNHQQWNTSWNNDLKERMQRRIEPWIRRELQAILEDSDPSVIVHLATSLYILSLEENFKALPEHLNGENKFIEQLRPFLHEQTDIFWHELRCFARSSLEMTTYDSVVEYKRPE